MEMIGTALGSLAGLVGLVCYILVIVQMFQHGDTAWGIACIVLLFCCGIGYLIAFIYGWVKANQWGITNIMVIWSVSWGLGIVAGALNPGQFQRLQHLGR